MSNSPLVTYTLISPNRNAGRVLSGKKYPIDTITIHCVVGQVTAQRGCELFQSSSRQASCNYVVGCDGSIGLCVPESDRAWTTGGKYTVNGETGRINDYHAVTIEVASDATHPYAVTDAAYQALIRLVADIAKRNGMGELKWKADKSLVGKPDKQNMTVHRWFDARACPGDYLYERMADIAAKANAINFPKTEPAAADSNAPAPWARTAWDKAASNGVLDGTRPTQALTRQELAVVLDRVGLLEGGR